MNKKIFSTIIACLGIVASPASAADTEDIVALLADIHQAYLDCDADRLEELAHPDWFGSFNAEGQFVRNSRHDQVREQCAQGYSVDYQYEILKLEVHGNWAFVAGRAKSELIAPDGERTPSDLRMSWVLNRHEGAWKRYFVHVASVETPAD